MFQKNPGLVFTFADELGVEVQMPNQIRWGVSHSLLVLIYGSDGNAYNLGDSLAVEGRRHRRRRGRARRYKWEDRVGEIWPRSIIDNQLNIIRSLSYEFQLRCPI